MRDESVKATCLSSVLFFDLVSQNPEADIFSYLLVSWPPPPGPVRGPRKRSHVIYCSESSVCRESTQYGWLNKGATCCSLAHKHKSMVVYKHRRAHTVTWPSQGVGRDVSCATITTHGITRRQTDTDIYNPSNYNLLVISKCQSRKWEAMSLMTWQSKHPRRLQEVHIDRMWQHSLRWTLWSAGLTWEHVLRWTELCE